MLERCKYIYNTMWEWCEAALKIMRKWCEDHIIMMRRCCEDVVKMVGILREAKVVRRWCKNGEKMMRWRWFEGDAKMVQRWCGDAAKVMRRSMYNIHCISIEILSWYIISWQNLYLVSKHMVRFLNIWTQILLFSNF